MKKFIALFVLTSTIAWAQKGSISIEEPVFLNSDTISGTLVSPFDLSKSKNIRKTPLIIIIPGSGPTDRNGNSALAQGENNTFKYLADSLMKKGIATYRYDKIGIGSSSKVVSEDNLRFEDNVKAVLAIFAHFREDIGFKKIYIMGHSEGSLIGMLAMQKCKATGYISLAGPAQNAHSVLIDQISKSVPDPLKTQAIEKLDSVKAGIVVEKYNFMLASILRKSLQPYLQSWFKYTPSIEIAKIDQPVLIVQGGRDIQVPSIEGETLFKAKPGAKYMHYLEMNHVLKKVDESREQNLAAYADEDFPFPPTLIDDLAKWVNEH